MKKRPHRIIRETCCSCLDFPYTSHCTWDSVRFTGEAIDLFFPHDSHGSHHHVKLDCEFDLEITMFPGQKNLDITCFMPTLKKIRMYCCFFQQKSPHIFCLKKSPSSSRRCCPSESGSPLAFPPGAGVLGSLANLVLWPRVRMMNGWGSNAVKMIRVIFVFLHMPILYF